MKSGKFPLDKFNGLETPFYFYDMELLKETLKKAKEHSIKYGYTVHYAVKANANSKILKTIAAAGFGADCVSGNEVQAALNAGFPASKVVFAGVGKTDKEIALALDINISCFNVESLPELEAINELAKKKGKQAKVALRINPDVDAETHKQITTGTSENKFGINISQLDQVLAVLPTLQNLKLTGVHYHIGSQIQNLKVFEKLANRAMELQTYFEDRGVELEHINFGGGLGIDYENPLQNAIPDFESYFKVFADNVKSDKKIHFELGRSLVAQCGTLITRVVYVKEGDNKKFVILDGSMTELIRPALYDAKHKIENLSSKETAEIYDVVGPVCESSDTFAVNYELTKTKRGDVVAIYSAGAYGEVMSSRYNLRELPKVYFSEV